jgi:hypothetical protein
MDPQTEDVRCIQRIRFFAITTITESEHFVLALPRLYLLSILYVVYASAFASGGDQEPPDTLQIGKSCQ